MSINTTIRPFKGREHWIGMRVRVYRNLHSRNWSIVGLEGPNKGKVIAHADQVGVWGPRFIVSEAGRQRVIREGRKNVHAFIEGTLSSTIPTKRLLTIRHPVAYNPFRVDSFMVFPRQHGGSYFTPEPIERGGFAWGDEEGKAWVIGPRRV